MRVIVTDCKYKMSLAPIRSLSRAGYEVLCGEYEDVADRLLLGSRSKQSGGLIRYSRGDCRNITDLCRDGDVILPVGRATLQNFARHPELNDRVKFLVSPPEVLDAADDKAYVRRLAEKLGVPAPATFFPEQGETAEKLSGRVNYPCIIKYKNGEAFGLKSWERYSIVRTPEDFTREFNRMSKTSSELLAQDYLAGSDVGVAVVMDRLSRPVDFIMYVSEREYPLSGGPTCLCRTVFDRGLLKHACSVLSHMKFQGIAMMDFKGSLEKPYLLEINPRIWGSAALCHIAGSGFFESYVKAALGEAQPLDMDTCPPRYELGVRMKFIPHSLMAAVKEFAGGDRLEAASDLRASFSGGVRDGLWEPGDNRPFYRYMANLFSGKG